MADMVRCDGCGESRELAAILATPNAATRILAVKIGAVIGTHRFDVSACSVACYDAAMAKAVAVARQQYEKLALG
jgi:hypothetical protein